MKEEKPWYEEDSLWQEAAPYLFSQRRWKDAPQEVDRLLNLMAIPHRSAILDLCCGVGRHSLELARRGFQVTGVDRNCFYLDRAQEQGQREGLTMELVEEDMRSFRRAEAFDGAINLFTSFGYFDDPRDDRRVVENIHASLKPGGILMMEMMGKEILARGFRERDWTEEDGLIVLEERKVSRNWSWIESRWIIVREGRQTEIRLSLRLYSAAELTALLANCGFAAIDVFGDMEGAPYDHQARRLVVRARK